MDDRRLADFFTFLSFPSVSADPAYRQGLHDCADWLVARLKGMGLETELCPTPGHPVVLARNRVRPGRPTVLLYGHYDVQPVDPLGLWHHPPFEPHLENGVVTARGAADNKGQIFAHLLGIEETLRAEGDLPVNLVVLIEGEEEIGSPSLAGFLRERGARLASDVAVISDSPMIAPGVPTLTYGLRGVAAMEIRVTGPAKDLHSGMYGGAVANPVTVLARLIASLHHPDGTVAVPGFYDRVQPLAAWEREAWAELPLSEEVLRATTGAPALAGEPGYRALERIWARPTAEVNGLYGGYQGEGSKTVLPKEACAKLTFRLVPDQTGPEILDLVARHLREQAPPSVRVDIALGHSGDPYCVSPQSGYGLLAQAALRETFPGATVALTREGGSIPIVTDFQRLLGIDTLLLGLCLPDCNAHSPNETFPVANLEAGIRLNRALLRRLAQGA